ncbi:MAG: hypothetical protein ABSA59_07805 [Terriglobia bacterium]|jgi:hypothetical protein
MDWLLNHVERQYSVIQGAPLIFLFTWFLGLIAIWWILEKYVYASRLAAKDDLIRSYKEKLGLVPVGKILLSSQDSKRKINGLSALISQGQEIRERCPWPRTRVDFTKEREGRWVEEWNAWMAKVNDFFKKEMAPQATTKFQHTAGIEENWDVTSTPTSQCPMFDRQIQNLVDIMERIDTYL